jgi:uncharacterized protein (TIGR03437 family)
VKSGNRSLPVAAALLFAAALSAQPPAINQEGIFNAASRTSPSLPYGALAPGSRVTIEGLRFEQNSEVRLGSRTLQILSATRTRLDVLLPAQLPLGPSSVTVSNRDGVSRPFPVRVAAAGLGLYSTNGKGWGPARMERPFVLTGTGLGAERHPEIFIAGRRARLIRAAPRPGEPGIDEIEFEPPAGTPEGCFVPVLARLPDGAVSNTVAVPIGRCTPPDVRGDSFLLLGRIFAHIRPYSLHPKDFTQDFGAAVFAPQSVIATLLNPWSFSPPVGACTVYTGRFYSDVGESTLPGFFAGAIGAQGRAVGRAVAIRGHGAEAALPGDLDTAGFYYANLGIDKTLFRPGPPLFLSPGDYALSWTGGAANLTMPRPFTWKNASRLETLDRAAGVTVEWRDNPAPRIGILAVSVQSDTTAMAAAFCVAAGRSGRFHIPPEVLANLPPGPLQPGLPTNLLILAPLPDLVRASGGLSLATTIRAQSVTWR